jgi:hypothetical protein
LEKIVQSEISTISWFYALLFSVGCIAAFYFSFSANINSRLKLVFAAFLLILAGASFFLAGRSGLSPFSFTNNQTLGPSGDNVFFAITGVAGAVGGIVGSYFFRIEPGRINYRELLKPLSFCPVTLIPVIKMIEAANDTTFLGYILLFCLAYQTGFFWERLLKADSGK